VSRDNPAVATSVGRMLRQATRLAPAYPYPYPYPYPCPSPSPYPYLTPTSTPTPTQDAPAYPPVGDQLELKRLVAR